MPRALPPEVLPTWESRFFIETEAAVRFQALAPRLAEAGVPVALVSLAERAAEDERRHAVHCQRFVTQYGGEVLTPLTALVEYAPRALSGRQRLTYEMVAQCCLAETQSTRSLLTLLDAAEAPELKAVLQELARDEVGHSRLGWGYLTFAQRTEDLAFLSPLLTQMISGSAGPELFAAPSEPELPSTAQALLRHGVVPRAERRGMYLETLAEVVLPGLALAGVDTADAAAWVAARARAT